uniref:T9SS type B sorting domain-containing protein n=1 Tax=Aquimarina sediminis TaxID=2070536 RepID=UPI000FFEE635
AGTTDITYTVTDGNGCTSASSAVHTVTVNSLPTAAAITGATAVCMGSTIDLTEGTAGTIVWSSSNLAVATIDGSGVVTPVSAGTTDITYTVTDGNGCTSASSTVHTVTVIEGPTISIANGPTCSANSETYSLEVIVSSGTVTSTSGTVSNISGNMWSIEGIVSGVDIDITVTSLNGCQETISVNTGICIDANHDIIDIDGDIGGNSINIVEDNDMINGNVAILNTNVTITVIDANLGDGVSLDPDTGIVTVLPNTPPGEYTINYTLCSIGTPSVCDDAIVVITVTGTNEISNLVLTKTGVYVDTNGNNISDQGDQIQYTFTVENNGNVEIINIVLNDPLPGVEVMGGPIDLAAGEMDTESFTAIYTLTEVDLNSGSVSNQATVIGQNPNGEDVSDISDDPLNDTNIDLDNDGDFEDETITIIELENEVVIYTGLTPNGDGVNDQFRIIGLSNFPNNTLEIYNRWGVKVFEQDGYEQSGSKLFEGSSNGRQTVKEKEELPVGTYYYILKYENANGITKSKAGYLYINR